RLLPQRGVGAAPDAGTGAARVGHHPAARGLGDELSLGFRADELLEREGQRSPHAAHRPAHARRRHAVRAGQHGGAGHPEVARGAAMRSARPLAAALAVAVVAVAAATPARADDEALVRVLAEQAAVHTGPGFGYRVVYVASRGEVLPAIGRATHDHWFRVQ